MKAFLDNLICILDHSRISRIWPTLFKVASGLAKTDYKPKRCWKCCTRRQNFISHKTKLSKITEAFHTFRIFFQPPFLCVRSEKKKMLARLKAYGSLRLNRKNIFSQLLSEITAFYS